MRNRAKWISFDAFCIPDKCGVYAIQERPKGNKEKEWETVYVGSSQSILKRVMSSKHPFRKSLSNTRVDTRLKFVVMKSRHAAFDLESDLICRIRPRLNQVIKQRYKPKIYDKPYPEIGSPERAAIDLCFTVGISVNTLARELDNRCKGGGLQGAYDHLKRKRLDRYKKVDFVKIAQRLVNEERERQKRVYSRWCEKEPSFM